MAAYRRVYDSCHLQADCKKTEISSGTIRSEIEYGLPFYRCVLIQGTIETLLAGAVCGTTYALFSGQPLTIISATGPLLVFESILYETCK